MGYEPNRTFIVDHVMIEKDDIEGFTYGIIFPKGGGSGIYHTSIKKLEIKSNKENFVHVSTQEEWDFVIKKLKRGIFNYFSTYKEKSILDLNGAYYCYKEYVDEGSSRGLISFQEWLDKTGYKTEFKSKYKVGDYVVLTSKRGKNWCTDGAMDNFIGNIVLITNIDYNCDNLDFLTEEYWCFNIKDIVKHATIKEIEMCQSHDNYPTKSVFDVPIIFKSVSKITQMHIKDYSVKDHYILSTDNKYFKKEKEESLQDLINRV